MSRIGRHPIAIPAGVTVEIKENNVVTVKVQKEHLRKHFLQRWKSSRKVMKLL